MKTKVNEIEGEPVYAQDYIEDTLDVLGSAIEKEFHSMSIPIFAEKLQQRVGRAILRLQHYDRLDAVSDQERVFIGALSRLVADSQGIALAEGNTLEFRAYPLP